MSWPAVGVVVPTRDRPQLVRRALAAIMAQRYAGRIEVVLVVDQAERDPALATEFPVRVLDNERTPGLAGARNTGIMALDTELVAFCDDDDEWLPGKLRAQVDALRAAGAATEFVTCAIEVEYAGTRTKRLAGTDRVTIADLARSRMAMLHSSTFLVRRSALIELGLVAEDAPGSQNEDWDLLLRASRRRPLAHVDRPLVRVLWGRTSMFAAEYQTKIESLRWMLDRHPEIAESRPGAARVHGQLACWYAALGQRRPAARHARIALRHRWREPRALVAFAAAAGLVRIDSVLARLHARGRGI